ncbi:MAG: 16S rRNA (uracil(1498)-N(3))-methyltransferase [Rhodospirillales bacterium]|nr:16S rRNA (uracil(1498)-N(3))-methyltransferase [Rhodospirillales bacterium]MCB9996195.1 16S rRNA (uracil(1498)-N(3))-methyltransferase [Rhodospirillales bacterium]
MSHADHKKYPRLYVAQDLREGQAISLSAEQAHYLRNVLRRAAGDPVRLFNGRHGEWLCALQKLDKKAAEAAPETLITPQPEPAPATHLYFAPIKKARMDFLIEKAVELGVTQLHPVLTRNTEIRQPNEARIQAQITEAAEQCERLDLPGLSSPVPLSRLLEKNTLPCPLLACLERCDASSLADALAADKNARALLIGPEGGFTAEEAEQLAGQPHITAVSLGPRILRAETAALYGLSLLQAL